MYETTEMYACSTALLLAFLTFNTAACSMQYIQLAVRCLKCAIPDFVNTFFFNLSAPGHTDNLLLQLYTAP